MKEISAVLQQRLGPMEQGLVTASDGVRLAYQSFGLGETVVFANGIGVRYPGALHQIETLRPSYRVICWDYRGTGESCSPHPDPEVSMGRQAEDILEILAHLGVARAVFVGWSMGVQVSLEVLRRQPERVAGFVALMGTFGRPFRTGLPLPLALAVEGLFGLGLRQPALAQALLDVGVLLPRLTFLLLSRLLFVGTDADREVFLANVGNVYDVDKRLYLRTMFALAKHDASDILPWVRCPSLVVCGQRDYLTPPRLARRMADQIPGAAYREVSRGTHFALIEQSELIGTWLSTLLSEVYSS